MEKKFEQGEWRKIFTSDMKRAIRNEGGIICTLIKPHKYSGQDERYDRELEENKATQALLHAAPDLLEALEGVIDPTTGLVADFIAHEIGKEKAYIIEQAIEKALN